MWEVILSKSALEEKECSIKKGNRETGQINLREKEGHHDKESV